MEATEKLTYQKVPARATKLVLLSMLFVAIGFYLLSTKEGSANVALSICCIVFFGSGGLIGLFHLFDQRIQLIVTAHSIWDRTTHEEAIDWESIKHARQMTISRQDFVALDMQSDFVSRQKRTILKRLNRQIGAGDVVLNVSMLDIDPKKLASFINRMIESDPADREKKFQRVLKTRMVKTQKKSPIT